MILFFKHIFLSILAEFGRFKHIFLSILADFVDAILADNFFEGSNDVRSGWKFFSLLNRYFFTTFIDQILFLMITLKNIGAGHCAQTILCFSALRARKITGVHSTPGKKQSWTLLQCYQNSIERHACIIDRYCNSISNLITKNKSKIVVFKLYWMLQKNQVGTPHFETRFWCTKKSDQKWSYFKNLRGYPPPTHPPKMIT